MRLFLFIYSTVYIFSTNPHNNLIYSWCVQCIDYNVTKKSWKPQKMISSTRGRRKLYQRGSGNKQKNTAIFHHFKSREEKISTSLTIKGQFQWIVNSSRKPGISAFTVVYKGECVTAEFLWLPSVSVVFYANISKAIRPVFSSYFQFFLYI